MGGPCNNADYNILGSILESPYLGKLPNHTLDLRDITAGDCRSRSRTATVPLAGAAGGAGSALGITWTPKVCKIMAFMAIIGGFRAKVLHTFGSPT